MILCYNSFARLSVVYSRLLCWFSAFFWYAPLIQCHMGTYRNVWF